MAHFSEDDPIAYIKTDNGREHERLLAFCYERSTQAVEHAEVLLIGFFIETELRQAIHFCRSNQIAFIVYARWPNP